MPLGWFGVCVWGFLLCFSGVVGRAAGAWGHLLRMEGWGGKCCVSDGSGQIHWLHFGVLRCFLGIAIALTNADTEHPSRETLL